MSKLYVSLKHIALIAISILLFFPFFWMVSSALKTQDEMWTFPPTLWPETAQWHHFIDAWNAAPFGLYLWNSSYTAVAIVVLQTVSAAMTAYAFTQWRWRGQRFVFFLILATYMLPAAATYVPSYIILSELQLLDTHSGLIISNAVSVFGIFLFRQSFASVSHEVIQAARLDGASEWSILWRIVMPMTKPTFVTFALISFVQNYNSYLWPSLLLKSEENHLITTGLRQFFIQDGAYGTQWPVVMAASAFAVFPLFILFLIAQKRFMQGISDRGVKG